MTRDQIRRAVDRAVKSGALIPLDACERCGKLRGIKRHHAHHHNGYAPDHVLDVQWLCPPCHRSVHGGPVGGTISAAKLTAEEHSERGRQLAILSHAKFTPEERQVRARHAAAAAQLKVTQEVWVNAGQKGGSVTGPSKVRGAHKGWETRRAMKAAS